MGDGDLTTAAALRLGSKGEPALGKGAQEMARPFRAVE